MEFAKVLARPSNCGPSRCARGKLLMLHTLIETINRATEHEDRSEHTDRLFPAGNR